MSVGNEVWNKVSIVLDGPQAKEEASTFRDMRLDVTFTNKDTGEQIVVPGFFAADGNAAETGATEGTKWQVNFTPASAGNWTYEASFREGKNVAASTDLNAGTPVAGFQEIGGSFEVAEGDGKGDRFSDKGIILQDEGTHYLQFQGDGDYFIKGGPGVPENFLAYDGFDNTKVTGVKNSNTGRHDFDNHLKDAKGDELLWDERGSEIYGAVNYLSDQKLNTLYIMTNTVGGDGRDVSPWVNPKTYDVAKNVSDIDKAGHGLTRDDFTTYDVSKLAQWERVFDHMDAKNIYKNILLQEIENDQLLNGGTKLSPDAELTVERLVYLREMIARFGHNNGLQWNLGEETSNSEKELEAMATYIKAVDPYDHVIVVHTLPRDTDRVYDALYDHAPMDGASFQTRAQNIRSETLESRRESEENNNPWILSWDEDSSSNSLVGRNDNDSDLKNEQNLREGLWGHLTANGSGANWYLRQEGGHSLDQNFDDFRGFESLWNWTAAATEFFNEYIPFHNMADLDDLTPNKKDFVFVEEGAHYVSYLPFGEADSVQFDLESQSGETFNVYWYNPREGGSLVSAGKVDGGEVVDIGQPPKDVGKDWVVYLRNVDIPLDETSDPVTPDPKLPEPEDSLFQFKLIDTDTDKEIVTVTDDDTIDFSLVEGKNVGIAAVTVNETTAEDIGSVTLELAGQKRTENVSPYALFGDKEGDYFMGRSVEEEDYPLEYTAFDGKKGLGNVLETGSLNFSFDEMNIV
ncbi:DUF5060 domain-containing protein [uncultured Roseibium sp.]|uniref:DUF5060 domain-containing protein n=1 Tax=uncultured Roseibium sp. TaxID=1936171 RepID=UPI002618CB3E|nr:DUF5060 domain-containing protein [uncultured Roseibium sp.]